jgi:hypothetical protein
MVADLISGMDHTTQAWWPIVGIVLVVMMFCRSVSVPSVRDVPWKICMVSIAGLGGMHWFGSDLGLVTSDEMAGLLPEGWGFSIYLRGDSGLPSRLFRLCAWVLLPWKGLAGMHGLGLIAASIAAVLIAAAAHRVAGVWGACCTWLVIFYGPWMRYIWEARAYPIFLMFCCWALWHAARDLDADGPPPLGGVLLAIAFAVMDNPLCVLLLLATVFVSLRRYGLSSIPKRVWAGGFLLGLACLPMVFTALTAHQKVGHPSRNGTFAVLGLALLFTIPGVFARGRRGWLAESAAISALLLGGVMLMGNLPIHERVILFVLPWCLLGFLAWIPRERWWGRVGLVGLLILGLGAEASYGERWLKQQVGYKQSAQIVEQILQEMDPAQVSFEPTYSRIMFLSLVMDMRSIQHRNYEIPMPEMPERYRPRGEVSCAPGEVGVVWVRAKKECDCPQVAVHGVWKVYQCPDRERNTPPAGSPEGSSVGGE